MLNIQLLDAGYCTHPQFVVLRNFSLRPMQFHSMFAVIEHPKEGVILFDTGYSMKFLETTKAFPERIYTLTTPVYLSEENCAIHKLKTLGIAADDVRHIIISHFHADHYAAIGDFPKAKYWFDSNAWEQIRRLGPWKAVFSGFLPGLIPSDFMERARPLTSRDRLSLSNKFAPFRYGVDMFGDGSIILVELSGHATGQLGCFVHSTQGKEIFLVADACWTSKSYQEKIVPHPITKILFSDYTEYKKTLYQLHHFAKTKSEVVIVPSHCPDMYSRFCNRGVL